MTLCEDCIHAMVRTENELTDDDGDYCGTESRIYCAKTATWIDANVVSCKYRQVDDVKYARAQEPDPKIPGKVYMWDCCTISGKCFRCQYYHKPSEGIDPHKCPFGLRQRLRRIG